MFVGENVKGLLSLGEGAVFRAIVEEFASCGYLVFYSLLNAKNYGVPQDRERLILVGIRKDLLYKPFEFPEPEKEIPDLTFLATLPKALSDEICQEGFSSRYMSRNRKRRFNEVSFTIPATAKQVPLHPSSDDMKKVGKDIWEFGKHYQRLSYKEAALIQSFPPDFQFFGNLNSKYQQIGNAVPPELAFRVAKKIYEYIENLEGKDEKE
jgi:DNA (cytosine-5)-methyltransferase 1